MFPAHLDLTPSFLGVLGELPANIPAPTSNPSAFLEKLSHARQGRMQGKHSSGTGIRDSGMKPNPQT